jgi:3-hydroxyisobutyrate dehydrogenase-like beta-hydroxyacid dehydrogenase
VVAAGAPAALAAVQPLLDAVGQKTWPFGAEPYRANVVKIAGNFMLGSAIEAMAEATALARGHGVAAADLLDMLTGTLFAAPVYKNYGALIAAGSYEPAAFALSLGLKDIKLALAASEAVHAPMPFASVLRDQLVDAIAQGDGARDFAALAKVAARRAGQDG